MIRNLLRREWLLLSRSPGQGMAVLGFFILAAGLFPLGIGPEPALLKRVAPGVIWVCALLAALLGLPRLFEGDYLDGTLEQMVIAPSSFTVLVAAKIFAHWLITGLPLVLLAPVLALQFGVGGDGLGVLALSLIPGTLLLSLIGAVGAALTLGLRNSGVLVSLLVLPLYVPVLIFGAGALEAHLAGTDAVGHLSLLAAFACLSIPLAPWASALSLRIALE